MADKDLTIRLIAQTQDAARKLSAFGGNVADLGKRIDGAANKLAKTLGVLTGAAVGAGAAIYALAVKPFAQLETKMAEVASLSGQTAKDLEGVTDMVLDMSVRFGTGAEDIAGALYDVVSAGFAVDESMGAASDGMRVLEAAIVAGQAGLVDTKVAADAITTVINSFGFEASEAGRVADVMFQIVKRGKTTMGELAPVMGRVSSLAAQSGATFEDVGAILATFTRAGVRTEEAVTGLRAILSGVISPAEQARKSFEELMEGLEGSNAELSSASIKSMGLVHWLREVIIATDGNIDALAEIFPNIRALGNVAVLAGDQLDELVGDLGMMENALGAAGEAQANMTQRFEFQWDRMWAIFRVARQRVGQALTPMFTEIADGFSRLSEKVMPAFIAAVKKTLGKDFEVIAGRVRAWFDGIADDAENNLGSIQAKIEEGLAYGKDIMAFIVGIGKGITETAIPAIKQLEAALRPVYGMLAEIFPDMQSGLDNTADSADRAAERGRLAGATVVRVVQLIVGLKIVAFLFKVVGALGKITAAVGKVTAAVLKIGKVVATVLAAAGAGLAAAVVFVVGALAFLAYRLYQIRDLIAIEWGLFKRWVRNAWGTFTGWVASAWEAATGAIGGAISWVWDTLRGTVSGIFAWLREKSQGIWGAVSGGFTSAWDSFKALVGGWWDWLKSGPKIAYTWVKDSVAGAWKYVAEALAGIWEKVEGWLKDLPGRIKAAARGARRALLDYLNPFKRQSPSLLDHFADGMGKVRDMLGALKLDVGWQLGDIAGDALAGIRPASGGAVGAGEVNIPVTVQGVLNEAFLNRELIPALRRAVELGMLDLRRRRDK